MNLGVEQRNPLRLVSGFLRTADKGVSQLGGIAVGTAAAQDDQYVFNGNHSPYKLQLFGHKTAAVQSHSGTEAERARKSTRFVKAGGDIFGAV